MLFSDDFSRFAFWWFVYIDPIFFLPAGGRGTWVSATLTPANSCHCPNASITFTWMGTCLRRMVAWSTWWDFKWCLWVVNSLLLVFSCLSLFRMCTTRLASADCSPVLRLVWCSVHCVILTCMVLVARCFPIWSTFSMISTTNLMIRRWCTHQKWMSPRTLTITVLISCCSHCT